MFSTEGVEPSVVWGRNVLAKRPDTSSLYIPIGLTTKSSLELFG